MNWISVFWLWWNYIGFIPLTICSIHRLLFKENEQKMKTVFIDSVVRCCLAPSLIYYVLDSVAILSQYHRYDWCNLSYFLHHVISLTAYREMMTLPYYPFFTISPFAVHCVLLMFPNLSFFNYIYFGLLINCLYQLNQKPWKDVEKYYWVFKIMLIVILVPITMLWYGGCKNNMLNVD